MASHPLFIVLNGDSLDLLRSLPDNSIDAVATDPPAGIAFMGKAWDKFSAKGMKPEVIARQKATEKRNEPFGRSGKPAAPEPGEREAFVAFMTEIMTEVLRVLKPGGHILVWGIPRTCHWTAWAIESAGFEIRDTLAHFFGQGFPKSLNVAKAIQKRLGIKPLGKKPASLGMANNPQWNALKFQLVMPEPEGLAARWEGFGTALKPAREDWVLARKPIGKRSIVAAVLEHGTGALNLGGCTIGPETGEGRWPANLVLSHTPECEETGTREVKTGVAVRRNGGGGDIFGGSGRPKLAGPAPDVSHGEGGRETIPAFRCAPGCAVALLDAQAETAKPKKARTGKRGGSAIFESPTIGSPEQEGTWPADPGGGVSRFFYVAKPARSEKEAGCAHLPKKGAAELTGRHEDSAGLVMTHDDGSEKANPYAGTSGQEPRANFHPTVKPIALMRWLVRLITPPGGVVLDPFSGSGTTGVAAVLEGFRFIGYDLDPEYVEIARARIIYWSKNRARMPRVLADDLTCACQCGRRGYLLCDWCSVLDVLARVS